MGSGSESVGVEEVTSMIERYGSITVERDGHLAIVEIHRPPHNYASIQLMRDLADTLEKIDLEPEIRCCVLATEGKSFCAGADFSTPTDVAQPGNEGTRQLYVEAVRLFSIKKPIIALVQGAATQDQLRARHSVYLET